MNGHLIQKLGHSSRIMDTESTSPKRSQVVVNDSACRIDGRGQQNHRQPDEIGKAYGLSSGWRESFRQDTYERFGEKRSLT
jgi:hypothetical protein